MRAGALPTKFIPKTKAALANAPVELLEAKSGWLPRWKLYLPEKKEPVFIEETANENAQAPAPPGGRPLGHESGPHSRLHGPAPFVDNLHEPPQTICQVQQHIKDLKACRVYTQEGCVWSGS